MSWCRRVWCRSQADRAAASNCRGAPCCCTLGSKGRLPEAREVLHVEFLRQECESPDVRESMSAIVVETFHEVDVRIKFRNVRHVSDLPGKVTARVVA